MSASDDLMFVKLTDNLLYALTASVLMHLAGYFLTTITRVFATLTQAVTWA